MTVAFSVYALGATDRLIAVLSFLKDTKLKTIVFIDGYNLYYGLLRRSPYKWLDLYALFQNHVLQNSEVLEVRYYTAPVLARMSDDIESPKRQRTYLQALRKQQPQQVTIIEGKMIAATPFSRLVETLTDAPHIRLGLVAPIKNEDSRAISKDLSQYATWSKVLSVVHLSNAQLPDKIHSTAIRKPDTW